MKHIWFILFFLFAPVYAGASVIMNEIAWMGTEIDYRDEWIELRNETGASVDLSGWILSIEGKKDIPLEGTIPAEGFFVVRRPDGAHTSEVPTDLFYSFGNGLTNSGEILKLKDSSGVVIDEINAFEGWPAGNNDTKETMQRSGSEWITAPATPRAQNASTGSEDESSDPPSVAEDAPSDADFTVPLVAPPQEKIRVFAGEDTTGMVGAEMQFSGSAFGLKGEPLASARFWWNFGDGQTQEGKTASHAFLNTGEYRVGLHVSSGEYAASDYLNVSVIPNKIAIKNVVTGTDGFIEINNPSGIDINIGGWRMADSSGNAFFFPPKTYLGARSAAAFSNEVTGLLRDGMAPVSLSSPNQKTVIRYEPDERHIIEEPTPVIIQSPGKTTGEIHTATFVTAAEEREKEIGAPVDEEKNQEQFASVSRASRSYSPFFFLAAVFVSIIGAGGFLVLKK